MAMSPVFSFLFAFGLNVGICMVYAPACAKIFLARVSYPAVALRLPISFCCTAGPSPNVAFLTPIIYLSSFLRLFFCSTDASTGYTAICVNGDISLKTYMATQQASSPARPTPPLQCTKTLPASGVNRMVATRETNSS